MKRAGTNNAKYRISNRSFEISHLHCTTDVVTDIFKFSNENTIHLRQLTLLIFKVIYVS